MNALVTLTRPKHDVTVTFRKADCGPSLRVRGGKTSTARADIQTTVNPEFFLHRRKAALSPY
jgi:hypothetical protein